MAEEPGGGSTRALENKDIAAKLNKLWAANETAPQRNESIEFTRAKNNAARLKRGLKPKYCAGCLATLPGEDRTPEPHKPSCKIERKRRKKSNGGMDRNPGS